MNCLAQDRGYLGVVLGAAIPLGDFSSTDQKNEHAGYAKTGPNFEVVYAQKFGKTMGITAMIRSSSNAMDMNALKMQFESSYPGVHATISEDSWKTLSFMAGGYAVFPITPKVSFDARLMGGLMSVASPELFVNLSGPAGTAWADQESGIASTFCLLFGGGFKFNVASRVCLLANLDIVAATANFKQVKMSTDDGNTSYSDFSQKISTVNLGIGVGYRL